MSHPQSATAGTRRTAGARPAVMVAGMIAETPHRGGATWAVLQYLLGFRDLGCEVVFVEPIGGALTRAQERYCADVMSSVGLHDRWALVDAAGAVLAGMDEPSFRRAIGRTDVLVNVSGMLTAPKVLDAVPVRTYLDLDPAFVQLWHEHEGIDMHLDRHTHFVSVSDAVGREGGVIPSCGRSWIATLPPVLIDAWPWAAGAADAFTTVAHWRGYGSISAGGVSYGQKAHSFRSLFELPRRAPGRFVVALDIHPDERDDLAALHANGWELVDPACVTHSPRAYGEFVRGSKAELGVAKSGYVLSDSGWFSDRSACYLASGRPVIGQDTGFGRRLPTGEGLLAFTSVDDAAAAVDELQRDPERHRRAAREIALEHLSSRRVLGALLEAVST